jgi:prevent-host-death family protein
MTSYDYLIVMNVGIADLKARLSEHLRRVRGGESITVLDRDTPVARLVPFTRTDPLSIRPRRAGTPDVGDVPLPPPLPFEIGIDAAALLREERGER